MTPLLMQLRDLIMDLFMCFGFHNWHPWTYSPYGPQEFCTRCGEVRPGWKEE